MMKCRRHGIYESTGNIVVLVVITLAAFAAYAGIGYEDFPLQDAAICMHLMPCL